MLPSVLLSGLAVPRWYNKIIHNDHIVLLVGVLLNWSNVFLVSFDDLRNGSKVGEAIWCIGVRLM